jgi:hypothetical protein
LTASFRWQTLMNIEFSSHDDHHPLGESATRPIELRCGTLAALLRQSQRLWPSSGTNSPQGLLVSGLSLAGTSPQRRLALPAHRIAAHSGASNCRI